MNDKLIEARLERSLRHQVKARRLPKSFDAAVWARIDAAAAPARAKPAPSSNWLFLFNVIGVGVALALVAVFGLQSLSGVEASVTANVTLPEVAVSATTMDQIVRYAVQAVTVGAVGFGLTFTPLGRRVTRELRALL